MGIRFMSENIEDAMYFDINYFRVSYLLPHLNTEKGKLVLESLRNMSEPLNMKLIIDGVDKNELYYVKESEIDLVSYGKELLIDDILKKMERPTGILLTLQQESQLETVLSPLP